MISAAQTGNIDICRTAHMPECNLTRAIGLVAAGRTKMVAAQASGRGTRPRSLSK